MSIDIFQKIEVAGIPLLFIVLGLVQYVKSLGLKGNAIRVASMVIGLLLGVGYQYSLINTLAMDFQNWFSVIVFGLGLGLVASGVYDVANKKE